MVTVSTGKRPTAVSPESIRASEPSNTALATSLASARVGRGLEIIDSSIWVAVITGQRKADARAMIRFCSTGTWAADSSTPRSPRATITASEAWMISSRWSRACGFSSLAMSGVLAPAHPIKLRARSRSRGSRMNDRATKSTWWARANCRSARSFSVSDGSDSALPGRLTPLRSPRVPPCTTRQRTSPFSTPVISNSTAPSASSTRSPARTSSARRG